MFNITFSTFFRFIHTYYTKRYFSYYNEYQSRTCYVASLTITLSLVSIKTVIFPHKKIKGSYKIIFLRNSFICLINSSLGFCYTCCLFVIFLACFSCITKFTTELLAVKIIFFSSNNTKNTKHIDY